MIKINRSLNTIQIIGNIKAIEDRDKLMQEIGLLQLSDGSKLTIKVIDSFAMPSATIGYLLSLVKLHKIDITLNIKHEGLIELLKALNINETINIQHIR